MFNIKGMFVLYIAQYPVLCGPLTALYTFPPLTPVHSDTNSTSLSWKHSSHAAITHENQITHIYTTIYRQVLIYTAESTGASMKRTKMPNLRNGSKGKIQTRHMSIASPTFYHWTTPLHTMRQTLRLWEFTHPRVFLRWARVRLIKLFLLVSVRRVQPFTLLLLLQMLF